MTSLQELKDFLLKQAMHDDKKAYLHLVVVTLTFAYWKGRSDSFAGFWWRFTSRAPWEWEVTVTGLKGESRGEIPSAVTSWIISFGSPEGVLFEHS